MHEFETFVYLDMEKTGSTFILKLLSKFCSEKLLAKSRHGSVGPGYDPKKFHFISVRNPLDAYLSLYSYGCASRGGFRRAFGRDDPRGFYDGTLAGFERWLDFVLAVENAEMLGKVFVRVGNGSAARLVGLQSFRYLYVALPDSENLLAACRSRDDVRALYAAKKLPQFVVRHETFDDDIRGLMRGPLRHAIPERGAARRFLTSAPPANASDRVDKDTPDFKPNPALMARLRDREWFLAETFGY